MNDLLFGCIRILTGYVEKHFFTGKSFTLKPQNGKGDGHIGKESIFTLILPDYFDLLCIYFIQDSAYHQIGSFFPGNGNMDATGGRVCFFEKDFVVIAFPKSGIGDLFASVPFRLSFSANGHIKIIFVIQKSYICLIDGDHCFFGNTESA